MRFHRTAILGNSGSGKSTLARQLAQGNPILDLDTVAWEPGPRLRDHEAAAEDVRRFCRSSEEWIIEGCYADLIAVAQEFEAELVFLNPGVEACLERCRGRAWEPHKFASKEEQDARLEFLLGWVAEYPERTGPLGLGAHRELFSAWSGPKREIAV